MTTSDREGQAVSAAEPSTQEGPSRARRAGLLAAAAVVCYALTLCLLNDSLFFLAVPGIIGGLIVILFAVQSILSGLPTGVPYSTDGTDGQGAAKYHSALLSRRFASIVGGAAVLVAVATGTGLPFLFPLVGVGIGAVVVSLYVWPRQIVMARRCAKVLDVYPLRFRAPVTKTNLEKDGRRVLRIGVEKDGGSPLMVGRDPMLHTQWPKGIADGVWFAGDDAFGGVLLVPGTGELMLLQPRVWLEQSVQRQRADAERVERANRAGLTEHLKL